MKSCVNAVLALAVASAALAFSSQSHATVFAAWQVAGVPFGDTLNARKYPSGFSQKQAVYPNGAVLQNRPLHRRRRPARNCRPAALETAAGGSA